MNPKHRPRSASSYNLGHHPFRVVGGVGVVAVLLLLGPSSHVAAGARPSSTHVPPYAGSVWLVRDRSTSGCGSTAQFTKVPSFSLSTGTGLVGEKAQSSSCGSSPFASGATALVQIGLVSGPINTTTGKHSAVAQWNITWNTTLVTSVGPGGNGTPAAEDYLLVMVEILDATNQTTILAPHSWSQDNYSFASNQTVRFHGSVHVAVYLNASLKSGHVYYFVTYLESAALSSVGPPGGTASASLNIGRHGASAKLGSIAFA